MKSALKKTGTGLLALVLMLALLPVVPVRAASAEEVSFDFRAPSDASAIERKPSELYEALFGSRPSENEITYLDSASEISFRYSDALPLDLVQTLYNRDAETLEVTATAYTYVARNGVTVSWIPQSLTVGDRKATLVEDNDAYTCTLDGVVQNADFDIDVSFACALTFDADMADALLNAAWYAGCEALAEKQEYEAAVKRYDDAVEKYLAYVAYSNYLSYAEKLDRVKDCLSVMEGLYVSDSRDYNFYTSLMGGTVDQVINRKAELVAVDRSVGDLIDQADAATQALRPLMEEYAELRKASYASEHARWTALFGYYAKHYDEIGDQIHLLSQALDALSANRKTQTMLKLKLILEGKYERYQQFLGMLYAASVCLNDDMTYDSGWKIFGTSLSRVLESIHLFEDRSYAPSAVFMPVEEVPYADAAEYAEQPQGERPVSPLTEMQTMLIDMMASGALAERSPAQESYAFSLERTLSRPVSVDNEMVIVFYDTDRTTVLDQQTVACGASFQYNGSRDVGQPWQDNYNCYRFLSWVDAHGNAVKMVATKDMAIYANCDITTRYYCVTWSVSDNGSVYTEMQTDYVYGDTPVCPIDVRAEGYESRIEWAAEIAPITGDITYSGICVRTPKLYKITWILPEGRVIEEMHPWGSIPAPAGGLDVAADGRYYANVGWEMLDRDGNKIGDARVPVTGDAIYRGLYTVRMPEAPAAEEEEPVGLWALLGCNAAVTSSSLMLLIALAGVGVVMKKKED